MAIIEYPSTYHLVKQNHKLNIQNHIFVHIIDNSKITKGDI